MTVLISRFVTALCLARETVMLQIQVLLWFGFLVLEGNAAPTETSMTLRFAEEPADTQFAHTQYAVLNCIAAGSPKTKVTWRLARTNVKVTNVTGLRYVMPNGSLVFPPFSKDRLDKSLHQAGYQCIAQNKLGQIISRVAKLRAVVVKPFSIYAVDHKVMVGNTAVIKAVIPLHVRDYVKVKAWYKVRNGITTRVRVSIMPSGDLVITNVQREDSRSAMYYFTAVNKLTGEIQASNPAKLKLIDQRITKSRMTSDVHNLTVTAGEIAELQCTAKGYPSPEYAWRKNGISLKITADRFKVFAGGSLRIERTMSQDEAIYTCEAINSGGSDSIIVHLKVHVPITFKERPKPQAALVGFARMELECDVIGKPKPSITWYHNAMPVDISEDRISNKYDNLVFATVYPKDLGMYQCVADNGVELEQSSAEFYVGFKLPEFTTPSEIKILNPGERLEISCEVTSTPTPYNVFWYHDGERLGNTRGYDIKEIPGKKSRLSKLRKSAVSLRDSGEYKCSANNAAGSEEQNITVYVWGGPNITYFLHKVTGVQGDSITLPCRVKGYPLAKITWTKFGHALPFDQRQSIARNGTLFIKNVQKNDRGQYKCTAAATSGKKVSITVEVEVMVAPVITPLRWRPVKEGQRAFETCIAAMGDLPLNVTWFKDGRPLRSIPGDLELVQAGMFGKAIIIAHVHERHAGTYTCVVGNRAGISKYSEQLVVYLGSKFIEDPKDQQVLKQHTAYLTCKTTGYPPARVEWSKFEGGSFVNLNDDSRFSRLLNGTLMIRNVSKNDEGRYSCNAYNGVVGTPVSRQVSLIVHVPAAIVSPPVDRSQVVDGSVSFTCVAIGNLPILMTWYNGTKLLTSKGRVSIRAHTTDSTHTVNGTLRVNKLRLSDTTQYSCKVVNKFGQHRTHFRITAQERPSPPSKPTIGRVGAKSLVLLWTPEFDGNSPIKRYIIHYKPHGSDWKQALKKPVLGSERSYRLQKLKPATNYDVRLYAENAIGVSKPGKEVTKKTKEDAPSRPPKIVNVTAISSTEVYIEWQPPPKEHCNGIIIGYYISYNKANSNENLHNKTVSGGAIRSHVITGLAKYKSYRIVIQAFTRAGPSPTSDREDVKTLEDVPSKPPQFVEVKVLSSQSISVTWKRPHRNSIHGKLRGYKIRFYRVTDPDKVQEVKVGSAILNDTLMKLGKFTTYKVSVLAFTSKGDGVTSNEIKVTTAEDIPGPPDDVQAIPVSRKQIRVRWKQPKEPNGIIREYKVFFSTSIESHLNDTSKKVYMLATKGNITSGYLKNLESDTIYYFWVVARTSVGTGNKSKIVKKRTQDKIVASIFDPILPDTMAKWKTSAILNCETYGDPEPTIFWYSGGKDLSSEDKYEQFSNGSIKIKYLEESDTGDYVCTASNLLGKKTVIRKLKVQIPPSPPKGITFKSAEGIPGAINISWTPGFDGYSNVTVFLLEYKVQNKEWNDVYLFKNSKFYILHKVDHTKPYFFKMSAINGVGRGRSSRILKVTFAAKGTIATVKQVDSVEEEAKDNNKNKRFYHDPAILGTLITVSVLIIIVLLLLVACRFKHITWKLPTDWRDVWDKAILGHPSQRGEETSSTPPDNHHGDDMNGNNTESLSPSSDGHLADSSSSVEQMASTRGSLLSLPRSSGLLHHNLAHEPIMEEPFPPPPPPYQGSSPMRSLIPPPMHHDDNISDTSSEISFGGPVYHRPMLHDTRPTPTSADPCISQHPPVRSLNGTPGVALGMRGPADGGSELDNTSLAMRGHESNVDLRKTFGSRLGRNSKTRGMSEETVRSIYARTPASGISRVNDSVFGSRNEIGRKSVASRRGSNASQKVAPLNRPPVENLIDTSSVIYRRDSASSKESSSYPPEVEKAIAAARDARAYDSTSSEYSSSRDELYAALEFGKRNNFEKYYGIPTLETTSMSSEATNSSEQDGICKFSGSPRTVGDGFYAPVPLKQPYYNPRSRSRQNNDTYLFVLDPRRRVMDGGPVRVRSQHDHKGSLV